MMPTTTVQHDQQLDSTSSAASTPRADHQPRLRFMCSFGGKILPRPHDNQLRYVGGDTRIIAVSRHTTFSALISKLAKTVGTPAAANNNLTVKYQLPNEDLDALISVSNDEDVENMMEEYERIGSKTARLRLFLFDDNNNKNDLSRTNSSSINSLLNGSSRRENWFIDALNGGCGTPTLERGLSEASSIVSEVPDYLFGLDNSDHDPPSPAVTVQPRDPKVRTRSNLADCVSHSDPGSPAPDISSSPSPSPFFATSSAPNLPMVRTKVDTPSSPAVVAQMERQVEPAAAGNPMWQYNPDPHYSGPTAMTSFQPMPVYYIPGPVQPGNYPVQPQFVQLQPMKLQPPQQPQLPVGYHQAGMGQMIHGVVPSGGMMRPMGVGLDSYDAHGRVVIPDRSNHPVPGYNGPVHVYPAGVVAAAGLEDQTGSRSDAMGSGVGQ